MICLYAIVDDPAVVPAGLSGHGGARLFSVAAGPDLAGVCSEHHELRVTEGSAALWVQNRIVDHLMARCAVAPVRFGTTMRDPDLVVDLLRSRDRELLAALDRVRGRVELALRASAGPEVELPATGDAPCAPSGRGYLSQLASRQGNPVLRHIHASLAGRAAGSTARFDGPTMLSASYLVDREEVDDFTAALTQLVATHAHATVSLTGPWAPFSFVEGPVASIG